MAQIVETIAGDRRVQLANEEFVRKFAFGSLWAKLRISLRISINGSANITTPKLFIGVCSGLTNTFKSSNTNFAFGMMFPDNSSGVSLNFNTGPPAWYQSSNTLGFSPVSRTGNTTTFINPGIGNTTFFAGTANNPPAHISVTIVKNNNNYIVTEFNQPGSQANVQAGLSLAQLLSSQDNETSTPWPNNSLVTAFTGTQADNHTCDCLSIFWDQASPSIEVSDIQVVRFM